MVLVFGLLRMNERIGMLWCGGCEGVFGGFCCGISGKGCPSRLTHNTMFGRLFVFIK